MSDRKKLIDVFPDWLTGTGIFSALQSLSVPWQSLNIEDELDMEYFGNVSGYKYISPLIEKMMAGDELISTEISALATIIYQINNLNWTKEWATRSLVYDPIENYDMEEKMTNDKTVIDYGKTNTRTDKIFGFNSATAVDTGTGSDALSGEDSHTRNYTLTRSGNIGVTTSQQMIMSERELWRWNFFRDVVFPDIDRVIATMVY